ncbi:MAG: hypothetical protein QM479_06265 [Pseudomonadota bacterium]
MWIQREIQLPAKVRGFHLITDIILARLPQIGELNIGLLNGKTQKHKNTETLW